MKTTKNTPKKGRPKFHLQAGELWWLHDKIDALQQHLAQVHDFIKTLALPSTNPAHDHLQHLNIKLRRLSAELENLRAPALERSDDA